VLRLLEDDVLLLDALVVVEEVVVEDEVAMARASATLKNETQSIKLKFCFNVGF
jgi:hypothetical protein